MTAPTTAATTTSATTWLREAAAVPVELARGSKARGLRVIAVTSVAQSLSPEPEPAVRGRLLEVADLVLDGCSPDADAMVTIAGLKSPVGPTSTIGAVVIVNAIKARTAELLVEAGAMPPVITQASAVGGERSQVLFDEAGREHARRLARAIDRVGGRVRSETPRIISADMGRSAPQRGAIGRPTEEVRS